MDLVSASVTFLHATMVREGGRKRFIAAQMRTMLASTRLAWQSKNKEIPVDVSPAQ
ncbi:MAG: hypothetical protein ABL912_13990 [Novosphingobium sp.]